jgi:hypothetical protein
MTSLVAARIVTQNVRAKGRTGDNHTDLFPPCPGKTPRHQCTKGNNMIHLIERVQKACQSQEDGTGNSIST